MRKTERKKIYAFELWCWRRVMRVSWMERKTNVWVLENVKPKWTLESRVIKAALRGMRGKRRRGRPRTKWLDTIKDVKGPSINIMRRDARERVEWRGVTAAVARGRTRLDGTR